MVEGDALALPPEAAEGVKRFVRAVHGEDDALIEALTLAAADSCERFTRRVLTARPFRETLMLDEGWARLARTPVRSISGLEAVGPDGVARALNAPDYALDIDANGDGWVRLTEAPRCRVRVTYQAGLAGAWADLPDALRHGVVRLAAHFYTLRGDAEEGGVAPEPPASVSALWRPFRRLSFG